MAVVVVGDIDPTEAEALVKTHFSGLKNPANERPREYSAVPERKKSEGIVVTDPEATNHVVQLHYSYQKEKEHVTIGDYRELLIRRLFTTMLSQRMQELTQQADPPFVFGGTFIGGYARGYEEFQSIAYLAKGGVEPALRALVVENERARKFGFTAAELDRTKKMLMKGIERAYNERDKTESGNLVDEYVDHFLNEEPIPGIENEFNYHKQFLDGITLEEVNVYAAKLIPADTNSKLVVLTGPEKADFKLPTENDLLEIANRAAQETITRYEEKAVASSLLEKTPTPGKIVDEKTNQALGTTELAFANGIKVILKPTDFKNDQVVMNSYRPGGNYLFDPRDRFNVEYAATIVANLGVADFSPVDLRKVLAGKNATVSPRISSTSESINGQSSASDVETLLQLTHLYFTSPRTDTSLFKGYISKQQALYQNSMLDPQFTYQDSIMKILYGKHPWAPKVQKTLPRSI
jgi:zinc protease